MHDPDPADTTYDVDFALVLHEDGTHRASCKRALRGRPVRGGRLARLAAGVRLRGARGAPRCRGCGGLARADRALAGLVCAREPGRRYAPVELHVVSDSTGETAARLVLALEAQFPDQEFKVDAAPARGVGRRPRARGRRAKGRPAVIVYTLVKPELRDAMRSALPPRRVHYCDLLGHPIESVRACPGGRADTPGARPALDEKYFRRIEAIEFAVQVTTTASAAGCDEADIVLVGVSRTSKTPLSIYLGYLGHKTANVPIVKGIEPPRSSSRSPREDRRPDDRRGAARRDPQACARARWGVETAVRRAGRDLRGARGGGGVHRGSAAR